MFPSFAPSRIGFTDLKSKLDYTKFLSAFEEGRNDGYPNTPPDVQHYIHHDNLTPEKAELKLKRYVADQSAALTAVSFSCLWSLYWYMLLQETCQEAFLHTCSVYNSKILHHYISRTGSFWTRFGPQSSSRSPLSDMVVAPPLSTSPAILSCALNLSLLTSRLIT